MARDNLEKFIKENRGAFDDKNPSDRVWKKIERRLPSNDKMIFWKIAAIVFFCTTIGLTYQTYLKNTPTNHDLAELESFYFTQIDYKQSLINDLQQNDLHSMAGLGQDLQKLDAMYKVLKEEWQKKPSKEVLEALSLNLIVRIDILNRQLQSLDSSRESESQDRSI